jgi:hypothetical protein
MAPFRRIHRSGLRASVEPVVEIGTDLVESAKGRVEHALDATDGRLLDLIEESATRATAGLHRVEKASPVVTVGRRRPRSRPLLFAVLVVVAAAGALVWWRRRAVVPAGSTAELRTESDTGARYEVVQAAAGGWKVIGSPDSDQPGTDQHCHTQAEAIEAAKRIASNAGGGEVVVHGLDGKPRTTLSVARTA